MPRHHSTTPNNNSNYLGSCAWAIGWCDGFIIGEFTKCIECILNGECVQECLRGCSKGFEQSA